MKRIKCDVCGRKVGVSKDTKILAKHRTKKGVKGGAPVCSGSGKEV